MEPKQNKQGLLSTLESEMSEDIHPLLQKITDNLRVIGLVIAAVVLVVGVYSGVTIYQDHAAEKSREQFSTILSQPDGQGKLTALEAFLSQAPSSMQQGVRLEMARLAMEIEAFEPAEKVWNQAARPGTTELQVAANLGRATSLSPAGKPGEALDILEELLDKSPDSFKALVLSEMAPTAEKAGNLERAVSVYEEIKSMTPEENHLFFNHKIDQLNNKIATRSS